MLEIKKDKIVGKIELIKRVNKNLQISSSLNEKQKNISIIVDNLLEEIEKALIKGDKLSLKGLFSLKAIKTKARLGINPITKEKINIPESRKISLKTYEELKNKLIKQE
ncbi:HU family DNA-binding protein [endosymbiont GvMRE of Glomus versiforme]|uniref:HU family DNA-binding protein n=1 Tax=endosymbiont GvMRE of Glomus versiforme TaxID=2039283 RepID=UPI000EBCDFE2|nr:HU family DNA-binding protein [endosymbiont GvMRE of Glomus versiforme]RHZ35453.1 DNA-binding protein HU [endosymbiont GvMRE of Glomus versiforme]